MRPGEELMVGLAANVGESSSDVSYVYERGEFYLQINAANVRWSVEVEELK